MVASKLKNLLFILLCCTLAGPADAGSRGSGKAVLPLQDIAVLSKKVEKYAAERSARVFLIARQGRPTKELPDGVVYTHVSFAVYSTIETEDGRRIPGYAIHNLYQRTDHPDRSDLVVDFPVDFLAGAQTAKVGVIIPRRDLQKRLLAVINSDTYKKLHNPNYSAISNPYNARYQNCTEHVLDVLNAAIYQTDDIKQLKANERAYFQAQTIRINPFKLFLASLFKSDIRTADQENGIETTTFGSIARYLQSNGLAEEVVNIGL